MISSLIVPPKARAVHHEEYAISATVQNCARLFVGGMGETQRERFRRMIQIGAGCCESIAQAYSVPLDEFVAEVKRII